MTGQAMPKPSAEPMPPPEPGWRDAAPDRADGDAVARPADSDHELLLRYRQQRDAEAFAAIIDRHQTDLLRTAWAILGDREQAQDAVQETFLKLVRDAESLVRSAVAAEREGRTSLGGWLCTVLRNHCFDLLRRGQRARFTVCSGVEVGAGPPPLPDERVERVWEAVASLPPLERAAVVLRYREGLSYQAIAVRMGKTATHVGVLLYQAMGRLRGMRCLAPEA